LVVFAAMFVFSDEMLLKDTKELRLPLRLPEVDRAPPRLKEERHVACAFARVAAKEAMILRKKVTSTASKGNRKQAKIFTSKATRYYLSKVSLGTYAQPSGNVLFARIASSSLMSAVAGARLPFLDARTEPRLPRLAPRAYAVDRAFLGVPPFDPGWDKSGFDVGGSLFGRIPSRKDASLL
jgi:hypothetical protein